MNYIRKKKLLTAEELIASYPLSSKGHAQVERDRLEIQQILNGQDPRLLVIVGPCSAWPQEAVLEYAKRLYALSQTLKSSLKIVMRLYTQKPRTTKGWMGPLLQPDPFAPADIVAGMHYVRKMMVDTVEMGLAIADECLFTHNALGFIDLLAWVAIGARSSEDPEHRLFASALPCPVGMKNPTHGAISIGVNSVIAAQQPHVAAFDGYEIQTLGNHYAHLVLRGSNEAPNYSLEHLLEVKKHFHRAQTQHPGVIIDVSHDNSWLNGIKNHKAQPEVLLGITENLKHHPALKNLVKGFMIESYLKDGRQHLETQTKTTIDRGGLSITDSCLGWEATQTLLLQLATEIQHVELQPA